MKTGETVLVTGATGFVGTALVKHLLAKQMQVLAIHRKKSNPTPDQNGLYWGSVDTIDVTTDWLPFLDGCDVVVHLAARAHVMHEQSLDPLAEFRRVNVAGTERLARQAAACGVRRFVYLSSIKVNGEETLPDAPFQPDDMPHPQDAYGTSKYEAELVLRRVEAETGLDVVIIRPPLIHGAEVKGNLRAMMRWLVKGVPLPFALLNNRRSLVGLDNLCDLIAICLNHAAAAGHTFLVSDGRDISTAELLQITGQALGHPARLFPMPVAWIRGVAAAVGKKEVARRLCGNLQVDISKTKQLLGWEPPLSIESGLAVMVAESKR